MKISIATILNAPADRIWEEVRTSRLLDYVAVPLLRFVPYDKARYPKQWTEGEYRVRMMALGILPMGWQIIGISYPASPDSKTRLLRDNGRGALIAKWDHLITVNGRNDGRTDYRDDVDIDAGLLTPFIAAYAYIFYRHRQKRWRKLVASGFNYGEFE
jgi:hypothetical protein